MTEPAPAPVASRRPLMAGLLMLVTAVAFEAQAVSTAMPAAADDLGQLEWYAWAFTAFMIPQIVAIVWGGRLADAVGPVRPLKAGIAIFAVGIAVSALAVSMPMLLAGRFVQGFGGGLTNLALMVVVGRAFPPEDTGRVMTWFSFAWMLPSFVGPGAAAWIVKVSSWHMVFWGILPLVVLGVALLGPALRTVELPGLHTEDAAPASLVASVAAAVGVGGVQAAGQAASLWSLPVALAAVVALVLATPRLMPEGWRPFDRGLAAAIGVRALMTGAFFGASAFLPLMAVKLRGLDLGTAGLVLTVGSLGWTAGSYVQSRPWLRISRDQILLVGTVLVAAGLAGVAACTWAPGTPLPLLIAVTMVAGSGMGLAMSSTSILVMQLSAEHQLGRNTSGLQVAEAMGNSVIAGVAGAVFAVLSARGDLLGGFGWAASGVALCAVGAALGALRVGHVPNLSASTR